MKVFIVYDEIGSIYAVRYGDIQHIPQKLQAICEEVADGVLIDGIDVSDPGNLKILFTPSRESALEKELEESRAQVENMSMMSGVEVDASHE